MPRPLRPIDEGLVYHVINRGNNRQDVFRKDEDYEAFLRALVELKARKPFELYGYCLMRNHFHLLVRPRETSISRIVQSLLVSHTQRYHKHNRSGGHVWQGRFKSPVIQTDEHLLTVLRYIEANPLRARIVKRADEYPWTSYLVHGAGEENELVDRLVLYDELSPYPEDPATQVGGEGPSAAGGGGRSSDSPLDGHGPSVRRPPLGSAAGEEAGPRSHDPPRGRPRKSTKEEK